jgi:hypothetical protein
MYTRLAGLAVHLVIASVHHALPPLLQLLWLMWLMTDRVGSQHFVYNLLMMASLSPAYASAGGAAWPCSTPSRGQQQEQQRAA